MFLHLKQFPKKFRAMFPFIEKIRFLIWFLHSFHDRALANLSAKPIRNRNGVEEL